MTPGEVLEQANQQYNSVGDAFFPDSEGYFIMWQGSMELATKAYVLEDSFETTTVAGTQEYAYPTNALGIKRVTYNGRRLEPIDFIKDDQITLWNSATAAQGPPVAYVEWEETLALRPIPDSAYTLKVYAYCRPQEISAVSTLEIPAEYHMGLVNLLLSYKASKNKDYDGAKYYKELWAQTVDLAISRKQTKKRAGGFRVVRDHTLEPTAFGFCGEW